MKHGTVTQRVETTTMMSPPKQQVMHLTKQRSGSSGSGSSPTATEEKRECPTADLNLFVDDLLSQMQNRFADMGHSILGRMDEMGTRIDELEQSLAALLDQTGLAQMEHSRNHHSNTNTGSASVSSPQGSSPTPVAATALASLHSQSTSLHHRSTLTTAATSKPSSRRLSAPPGPVSFAPAILSTTGTANHMTLSMSSPLEVTTYNNGQSISNGVATPGNTTPTPASSLQQPQLSVAQFPRFATSIEI